MEETIILAVDIETKQAQTQLDLLGKTIEDAQKKQEELNKQFSEGAITLEEYNKGTKENTKEIKAAETATKSLTTAVKAEENSITALSQKNKELIKERNSINTSTVEGANRIKEINRQIDENNNKIKENVSNLEQNRLNVGNYRKSLEGVSVSLQSVVPGLGGMTNGLSGITAGAKAFTATPFGATLQIIAGLLSVLIESFKGSEEGQRNLNKITQVTTALFGALGDLLRDLGGLLIDAFKNPKQALMDLADFVKDNLINRFKSFGVILDGIVNLDFKKVANGVLQFGSGVENVIGKIENVGKAVTDVANKALEQGNKVAKLQAEIEDLEDEANLRRAQNEIKIAKLREDSIKQEGDLKRKTIEEAIALEKQSADFSIKIAQKRVELAQAELATATNKKEATDKLEDAEVALALAQAERYQATLRFEKQLEGLRDADLKAIEKQSAEEKKLSDQREAEYKKWIEREEDLLQRDRDAALERRLLQNEQLANQTKNLEERYALLIKNEEISRDFQLRFTETTEQEKQLIIEQSNAKIVALNNEKNEKIKESNDKAQEEDNTARLVANRAIEKAAFDTLNFVTNTIGIANQKRIASYKKMFDEGKITEEKLNELSAQSSKRYKQFALAEIALNYGVGFITAFRIAQKQALETPGGGFIMPLFYATQLSALLASVSKARSIINSNSFSGGSSSIGGGSSVLSGNRLGVTETQSTTNPINQQFALANIGRDMTVVASWKEATEVRNRVEFKESLITV